MQELKPRSRRAGPFRTILWAIGPGLMVMLADTDAGSIVTAAQSGAEWRYAMVIPLLGLIPVLYLVQEMTVRIGLVTKQGFGALIRRHFGRGWAYLAVMSLAVASLGALITEYAGIAGAGLAVGMPVWATVPAAALLLIGLGVSGSYRRLERVSIALGLFELAFVPAAWAARPRLSSFIQGTLTLPFGHAGYLAMLAANIGAVIMPWMIFYQQSAVIEKGWTTRDIRHARGDTLIGSVVTQIVMISVVIATVPINGHPGAVHTLSTIQEIAGSLVPVLGQNAPWVFSLGILGASLVAAVVVSAAAAYGIGEVFNVRHSMNNRWRDALGFYLAYAGSLTVGAALVLCDRRHMVSLSIRVETFNALLLPMVLAFLLVLERRALPKTWRMRGSRKVVTWIVSGLTMVSGGVLAFYGLLWWH